MADENPLAGLLDRAGILDRYFAAIDAAELEWWNDELPAWQADDGGRITGASPWHNNREKLAEIDRQHGIAPDDPRVYSIRGYKADRLELEWQQLCGRNGWRSAPAPDASDFSAFWTAEYRRVCRRSDLDARHFGRLRMEHGHETESTRHLWAYITTFALTMLETQRKADNSLRFVDPILQRVYSALHEMRIPWADSPSYHPLKWQKSIDKLRSIANHLEADEAGAVVPDEPVATPAFAVCPTCNKLAPIDQYNSLRCPDCRDDRGTFGELWIDLHTGGRLAGESAGDETLCKLRAYVRLRFGEFGPSGMAKLCDWLVAFHGFSREQVFVAKLFRIVELLVADIALTHRVDERLAAETKTIAVNGEPAADLESVAGNSYPVKLEPEAPLESPSGYLGGAELATAMGVHATRRDAFFRQLERQRTALADDCWHEVRDPRPNCPRFLYRADSPQLRDLAGSYTKPRAT
ncbi:MAG: hypothetical protein WD872_13485 [Pirellulaceae bacterium]